ncbi:MAG: hypothetical protein K0S65_921 [Labilithrix sp.]|nr:hypothetical protein [Labilithrix sp.]
MASWLRNGLAALPLAMSLVAAACAPTGEEEEDFDLDGEVATEAISNNREIRVNEDPSLLVEHPETLRALEAHGFDFGTQLSGSRLANMAAFAASSEGKALIEAVEADVAGAKQVDGSLGVGMRYNHRAFDASWLRSSQTSFELVAVANRLDRRHATPGQCGEVHLIYRLAYTNAQAQSRLPLTVMMIYPQKTESGGCAKAASRWLGMRSAQTNEAKAQALAAGPLAGLEHAPRVEMNFQLLRWPSTTRQDMGGHAEYSLRVFERGGDGNLAPAALENTPREDLDANEQKALASWITTNVKGIDQGTAKLPGQFLAPKTTSVSPKGLARGQNRPFAVYFGKEGERLPEIDLGGASLATTKTALVRRLDTMTCNGCHQSQGVAGFHALGTDRKETSDVNALIDGVSAHSRAQLVFRKEDLASLARGSMALAPIPFAEKGSNGGYGTACGLGDPGFASWKCDAGFTCSDHNGDDLGICVSAGKREAGEACEEADVSFSADPHADKVTMGPVLACELPGGRAGRCVRSGGNPGGFPTGMCSGSCTNLGKVEGDAICGLSVPTGFNDCIGRGGPFAECVAGGSKQYRKACSADAPCGPDYVCSAVPNAPPGVGACLPPYFIFQARVDGHLVGK